MFDLNAHNSGIERVSLDNASQIYVKCHYTTVLIFMLARTFDNMSHVIVIRRNYATAHSLFRDNGHTSNTAHNYISVPYHA